MEIFNTVEELEDRFSEEQEIQAKDAPEIEYDYDNIDEDLSYLDEDIEDIDEDEEDDYEFFFGDSHRKYVNNKIYKSIPPRGNKIVDTGKDSFKRLLAKGYNSKVLGAIIGNGIVESNLNPGAVGDHGTAFGINQNRFEKADKFNQEYSKLKDLPDGLDKHIIAQYESVKNNYPQIFKKVSSARDFNTAAMVYGREYEKPKYLKEDRGTYADLITRQVGGEIEKLPVYQTFDSLQNPFNKYDTGRKSLFSENNRTQIPFMDNVNHIGYSPARTNLQATVPSDFGRHWDQSIIQYNPDNTQNTTLNTTGTGAFNAGMKMAGLSGDLSNLDPTGISQVVKVVDGKLADGFNFLNKAYDTSKDIRNLVAKTADAGLTGAISILSQKENDRLFNKQLKNMYRENKGEYYG